MQAYEKLTKIYTRIAHLQHLQAMMMWDEAVMMPSGGGEARANALAELNALIHETKTAPHMAEWLEQAKQEKNLNEWEQANLRWMEKHYQQAVCLTSELVEEITKATLQCEQAWRVLRAANNWREFAPLLTKSFALIKEAANLKAQFFQKSSYDVLIDEYSPDMNQAMIDPIFEELKAQLPHLIQTITAKQKNEAVVPIQGYFPVDKQRALGIDLMRAIGFDFERGRLDTSHHPFCGGVPTDVRITTRYKESEFISAMMGICHESGHACYEQGLPQAWLTQPVGHALGMSVHESQSLLMEMQACRTREFMNFLSPLVIKFFGAGSAYSPDNLFRLYTRVQPSLIRVDADEVTYPLHVILRYEIEKEIFADKLEVEDLPDAWDAKMQAYLGVSTKNNYRDGVMQDVHWPSGAFGYFPAYTLGSLIAAQLFAAVKKQQPDVLQHIQQGQFQPLLNWLHENVHCYGSLYNTQQLLVKATGEELNPHYFIDHIQQRYL